MALERIVKRVEVEMTGSTKHFAMYAKQGDKATRFIEAVLFNRGEPYVIPEGSKATAYIKKPDRYRVYTPCLYEENVVTIELSNNALAAAGTALCEVEIQSNDDSQRVTSVTFEIEIEESVRSDKAIMSSNEFTLFEKTMQEYADAEAARAQAETSRVQTEAARVQAETARTQTETSRVQAEKNRSDAETARTKAETSRVQTEAARVQAETARTQTETSRVQAEKNRSDAETARTKAEASRVQTEAARVQAETVRTQTETSRVQAEKNRSDAEAARTKAEASRVQTEAARVQAETARTQTEESRVQAEKNRSDAEAARTKAETSRAQTEAARVQEEKERQQRAQEVLDKANNAVATAEQVNEAKYIQDRDHSVKYAYALYMKKGIPHLELTKIKEQEE